MPTRTPRTTLALALTALLAAAPRPAGAQQAAPDALIARGNELRRAGRDEEALALFRQAWERARTPHARAEVALAEAATGRWVEAAGDLDAALAARGDPWVERHRAVLADVRATIARHLGALEVVCDVDDAEVEVDGRRVGVTPLRFAVPVEAGPVQVVVRAPGRPPASHAVTVPPGRTVRDLVALDAPAEAPAPPPAPATPPAPRRRARVPIPIADDEPPPAPPVAVRGTQRVLAWTAVGLAGASLAVGAVALGVQRDGRAELPALDGCASATACLAACRGDASCRARYESEEAWRAAAWAGFLAGGALAAAAVALFVTAPRPQTGRSAAASCAPSLASPGLACAVRF